MTRMVQDAGWSLVFVEPPTLTSIGLSKDHLKQLPRGRARLNARDEEPLCSLSSVKEEGTQLGQL